MTEFCTQVHGRKEYQITVKTDNKEHYLRIQQAARECVDNALTNDAVPVRHGRWVAFNVINTKDCSSKIRYMCNKCGRYEDEQEPYCNCGAKMDEVSE